MTTDSLKKRGKSLEDAYFNKQDAKHLEERKASLKVEDLRKATGLTDDKALSHLVDLGVTPETIEAIALVPLVHIAWADGEMEDAERNAILSAADEKGLDRDSLPVKILKGWLDRRPSDDLFEAWTGYIQALHDIVEPDLLADLAESITGFSRDVAEAAGGFLGIRSVSKEESKAIEQVTEAFTRK